jgi:hypothetical protein
MVVYTLAQTALVGFTHAQALEWASYNVQGLLQLLIFERDKVASSRLPRPVGLLLHGVESQDGNPVWPDEQHGLCGLPPQRREVTKHDLTWTVDRLVRGPDHRQKTFWCLELGLNLGAG